MAPSPLRQAARARVAFFALVVPALAVPAVRSPTTTFTSTPTFTPPAVPVTNVTSHGPYTGPPPTTTGALSTTVVAASIPARPPPPDAFAYPADGRLHAPQPAPYTPGGGLGTNGSAPVYRVLSDWDFQSVALALYQEWIELDLFHWGLATFSAREFEAAGLTAEDRFLLAFMADQEVGHATALSNMLGPAAPVQCAYDYPVANVREYLDLCQKVTRWGESGVHGFIHHLDARDVAQILQQSISVESRQQMILRQLQGLFPMPVWHEIGTPQSWAWTLLAPYIASCPAHQTRLVWQNFPTLHVLNQPNPARIRGSDAWNETVDASGDPDHNGTNAEAGYPANALRIRGDLGVDDCLRTNQTGRTCRPAITRNRTEPLSYPGREVALRWDDPGLRVGPNGSYVTSTQAGDPKFALWVTQLNATYTPLRNVSGNTGYAVQPNVSTYAGDPAVNGTIFLLVTDEDLYVTPFNLSMVNPHVRALALYQAG